MIISRRDFAKQTGGLVIGFSLIDSSIVPQLLAADAAQSLAVPLPARLDAWLRVDSEGTIRVFTGKPEIGMGVETGFMQIVAEELDVPAARVVLVMGDTATTADQGGVGGSTSIMMGAKPLRNAAATARLLLVRLAARRLDAAPEQLEVRDGVVSVKGDPSRKISYGELASGADLNDVMRTSGRGFAFNAEGSGKPKDPGSYTLVGTSLPRVDSAPKILGKWQYVTDVRVPGMLHGRVVRPPATGARVLAVDEESVKGIPGYVKTVVKENFVGVVAEKEWCAIQAAKNLKVNWSAGQATFPEQKELYNHMRSVAPKATREAAKRGDAEAGLAGSAKRITATYEFPFQSHATMGPGCAVADVQPDGITTVWSGSQKPHALQRGFAELLHLPVERIHVVWVEDAGSYGRPGIEDTAADAVLLSQAVGKPVRVQWMRADMTAWGSKGPAVTCEMSAGLDEQGEVSALQFTSHAFSGGETMYIPETAGNFLGAQLTGIANTSGIDEFAQWGEQTVAYSFKNIFAQGHVVPALYGAASPLRTTHFRDPEGPQATFAAESFIDEIAAAAGVDPIEFRLRYLPDDARSRAALAAAAEKFGWDHRASPKNPGTASDIVTGRGIALGVRAPRGLPLDAATRVATIAEVEVNRRTGAVRVKRFVCAHDCGLIVNPNAVRSTIAANLIQSMSRALKEEVTFDKNRVTSVDWNTYPVVRAADIPDKIDIVLINNRDIPPSGAGEPSSRPTAAAINNAIFDATGVRLRQAPLTPARIKTALAAPRRTSGSA